MDGLRRYNEKIIVKRLMISHSRNSSWHAHMLAHRMTRTVFVVLVFINSFDHICFLILQQHI